MALSHVQDCGIFSSNEEFPRGVLLFIYRLVEMMLTFAVVLRIAVVYRAVLCVVAWTRRGSDFSLFYCGSGRHSPLLVLRMDVSRPAVRGLAIFVHRVWHARWLPFILASLFCPLLPLLGCSPDLVSFNSAINACASRGKWQEAARLLEVEMPAAKVIHASPICWP